MVNPKTQERPVQDELRRTGLRHLGLASDWSAQAGDKDLTLLIARHIFAFAQPLLVNKFTRYEELGCYPAAALFYTQQLLHCLLCTVFRSGLSDPLQSVLGAMKDLDEQRDADLRRDLYKILMDCLIDDGKQRRRGVKPQHHKALHGQSLRCVFASAGAWDEGLEVADEAFSVLPNSHHGPLWGPRMVCMSKLGQDVAVALNQLKEKDPVAQAKIWLLLARSSMVPAEVLSAYKKALESAEACFFKAEVLIEFGQWLHRARFPAKDARDRLLGALDILLPLFQATVAEDDEGDEGTMVSSWMRGSRAGSKAGSKAGSRIGGGSTMRAGSVRAGSVAGKRTVGNSSRGKSVSVGGHFCLPQLSRPINDARVLCASINH